MNEKVAVKMRRNLPRYNTALGPAEETLVVAPPFTFPGVSARVFPLRANMNTLSSFCQQYLNVAPEVCTFEPYFPYVLLVVLDYGRMAIDEFNMGWVSQHEVFFAVPLGMWSYRGRRRVFEKWVLNTPFIVVDNAPSLTTGRETYGWPKVLAHLQYSPESWLIDPRNPTRFLTLDVMGPDSDRCGVRLMEIEQQVNQNPSLVPLDIGLIDPFEQLSRLSRTSLSIGFDLAQLLLGSPLAGFNPRQMGDRREVLFDSLRRLSGFYGNPGLDVVTLKQFRSSSRPSLICYQALVESRLSVARFNRGGLLGLFNLLKGDITGGFSIRLYDNPALPIVESLGLEVTQATPVGGRAVSILEPFFPFWMSVDLNYGRGETICWRTRDSPWYEGKAQVSRVPPRNRTRYNTVAGGAEQVWYGPYLVPDAILDIYPLRANHVTLLKFLEGYINAEKVLELELVKFQGDHFVYMMASENRSFSQARSGAWIESCQVAFYIPVLWRLRGSTGKMKSAMANPFAFVNNPTLAMSMREGEGVPAINALITTPSRLLQPKGPLLTVQVDVFESLGAGLRSQSQTLLEVRPGAVPSATQDVPLGEVFPSMSLDQLMLKQFRDAYDPDRACYQALVLEEWSLLPKEPPPTATSFEPDREVRIYRYPSLPLAETLGLRSKGILQPETPEGAVADILESGQPFRVQLSLEIKLGQELSQTAGYLPWFSSSQPLKRRIY